MNTLHESFSSLEKKISKVTETKWDVKRVLESIEEHGELKDASI